MQIIVRSELLQCFLEIYSFLVPLPRETRHFEADFLQEQNSVLNRWPSDRMCWVGVKLVNHILSLLNANTRESAILPDSIQTVMKNTLTYFKEMKSPLNQFNSIQDVWISLYDDLIHSGWLFISMFMLVFLIILKRRILRCVSCPVAFIVIESCFTTSSPLDFVLVSLFSTSWNCRWCGSTGLI